MTTVGQKETITQQKVTGFFQQALGYRYLGHWKERSGNANAEVEILRQWLHTQGREKPEEIRESIKALCEPVEPSYDTEAYLKYFIGPSDQPEMQQKNEPKRLELYKLTTSYLRAYSELANEMAEAGYSDEEAQTIKKEVAHYESVRNEVKLASGDYVDISSYLLFILMESQ